MCLTYVANLFLVTSWDEIKRRQIILVAAVTCFGLRLLLRYKKKKMVTEILIMGQPLKSMPLAHYFRACSVQSSLAAMCPSTEHDRPRQTMSDRWLAGVSIEWKRGDGVERN